MNIPFVDLKSQYLSIKDEIDGAISEVIGKTAFIGGPYVKKFEEAFASFCKVKHCVGVGNGTDALFIALKSLGIGPGDEVITAANSFIATSEAITMTGAKVVFVDINPKTYNMYPQKVKEYLEDDRQLALYALAVLNNYQDARRVKLVWHFLSVDKEVVLEKTQQELDKLKEDTIALIDKIRVEKDFQPRVSALCSWCEFRLECPAQKHIARTEKTPVQEGPYVNP